MPSGPYFKGFDAPSGKAPPPSVIGSPTTDEDRARMTKDFNFNKGGKVGGRRGDGIAQRGFTKGRLF
jgi:hypothetical protein